MISKKLCQATDKVKKVVETASTMVMLAPFTSLADDDFFQDRGITINSGVSSTEIINRLINIVAGVFIVIGLFQVAMAIFKLLEAHSEDNAAGQNKAIKQLCIGGLFIGAPALLMFLFA